MSQRPDREGPPALALDLRLVPTAMMVWLATAIGLRWLQATVIIALVVAIGLLVIWALSSGFFSGKRWYISAVSGARLQRAFSTAALPVVATMSITAVIWLRRQAITKHELTRSIGKVTTTEFTLATTPEQTPYGSHATAYIPGLPGQVRVFGGEELLSFDRGTVLQAHVAVKESELVSLNRLQLSVRGAPELLDYPNTVVDSVRSGLHDGAQALWPWADRLLPAMTLGDERLFTLTDREVLTASGLSHLSAVSGANIALLLGAVIAVLSWASPRMRALAAAAVLAGFVALVGTEPSVLRAMLTGVVTLLAIVTGRANNAFTALMAGTIGLIFVIPDLAVSVGFMLSVAATTGLVLLAEPFALRLKRIHMISRWPAPVVRAISVAIVAHCVTTPVLAITLQSFAPWSVLANLCAAPAVAPVTILGMLAAIFIAVSLPSVAAFLMWAAAPFAWWIYFVAGTVAALPAGGSSSNARSAGAANATVDPWGEGFWLMIAVAGTEIAFVAVWLWPQLMFRLIASSAALISVVGLVVVAFGLHIPRAPDGWVFAACVTQHDTPGSEILVLHNSAAPLLADDSFTSASTTELPRECTVALGISKQQHVQVAQHLGGSGTVENRLMKITVVDDMEEAESIIDTARTDLREQQQDSVRLIVVRHCGQQRRAELLSPDGTPLVCPYRDGPQALYPSGALWKAGR